MRRLTGSRRVVRLLGILAVAGLGACAESSDRVTPAATVKPPRAADPVAADTQLRTYRLGVGDKLKLNVYGEPDLSGEFVVNALGNVSLPLVGEVKAQGHSLAEFRAALRQRLADGFLKDPKVNVEVVNYRPIYVHGEVRNGGEFQFKNGLKLRDAVAMAGGYSYRANLGYVLVIREGEARELRIDLPSDTPVLPGDNIRIPERFF